MQKPMENLSNLDLPEELVETAEQKDSLFTLLP
jgi:hypothetical protein